MMLEPHGMPMTFSKGIPEIPVYFMVGDFIAKHEYWMQMRLKYGLCLETWKSAGGKGDICDLPDRGIAGNSHMLMMDNNSDQILDIAVNWLDSQREAGAFD
jgi:hypothetical protein